MIDSCQEETSVGTNCNHLWGRVVILMVIDITYLIFPLREACTISFIIFG